MSFDVLSTGINREFEGGRVTAQTRRSWLIVVDKLDGLDSPRCSAGWSQRTRSRSIIGGTHIVVEVGPQNDGVDTDADR